MFNVCVVAGGKLSSSDYGNLWKLDGPLEVCEEPTLTSVESCGDEVSNSNHRRRIQNNVNRS